MHGWIWKRIWAYSFKAWSREQADRYHHQLISACVALASGEKKGRASYVRDGYFQYPSGSHIVFYRPMNDGIDVVRILHESMDFHRHV